MIAVYFLEGSICISGALLYCFAICTSFLRRGKLLLKIGYCYGVGVGVGVTAGVGVGVAGDGVAGGGEDAGIGTAMTSTRIILSPALILTAVSMPFTRCPKRL